MLSTLKAHLKKLAIRKYSFLYNRETRESLRCLVYLHND